MQTASFLAALRANPHLPLIFHAGPELVPAGYHLTEVKRVSYETMDCGAMTHRWTESQFEIWAPALASTATHRGHMAAAKFVNIVDRVAAELPLSGTATARIHVGFAGKPAALHDIEAVTARDGKLWVELTGDRTRCKAAERRLGAAARGCYGIPANQTEKKEVAAGCGCDTAEPAAVACCA